MMKYIKMDFITYGKTFYLPVIWMIEAILADILNDSENGTV